jgi:hypothetical protein
MTNEVLTGSDPADDGPDLVDHAEDLTETASSKLFQLRLIHDELNRRRESLARRSESVNARAAVVIGSATIASGLQATSDPNWWGLVAIGATALAAALAILATFPRFGNEIDVLKLRDEVYVLEPASAELFLIDHKNAVHSSDEDRLMAQGRLLRASYILLGLSVAASFLLSSGIQIWIPVNP